MVCFQFTCNLEESFRSWISPNPPNTFYWFLPLQRCPTLSFLWTHTSWRSFIPKLEVTQSFICDTLLFCPDSFQLAYIIFVPSGGGTVPSSSPGPGDILTQHVLVRPSHRTSPAPTSAASHSRKPSDFVNQRHVSGELPVSAP